MNLWTWRAFITEGGRNVVKEWCEAQTDSVWMGFVATVQYLDARSHSDWERPEFAPLSGGKKAKKTGCAGLYELRFDVGNVEYRPIGYFSGKMEFTFLFFAIEKDRQFLPPNACEIAKKRMAIIANNKERAREFRLEADN